jgi:tRNA A58 N-methylase Trm61
LKPTKRGTRKARIESALEELRQIVKSRYPDATFDVSRAIDEPGEFDLIATVDVEDEWEVLDLVIDRVMEMQLKERLPVHVVPVRPLHRTLEEIRRRPRSVPLDIDVDLIAPPEAR